MMQATYDPQADALYLQVTNHPVTRTRQITSSFILDFDEAGNVVGVELLHVRQSDIDPSIQMVTPSNEVIDAQRLRENRQAYLEALRRQRDPLPD